MNQAGRMTGKVAIVTGAGTGLGAATTRLLAREGADVVAVGRRGEKLREVADELAGEGAPGRVAAVAGDVAVEDTASAACRRAEEEFGGLDVVVNNAGIHSRPFLVHETPVKEFEQFLAVDLLGPFLFTRAAAPLLLRRGGGAIVNISSMVALVGFKYSASYSAAKGGLISLTRATAADYGDAGIRANCLCPGGMEPVERGNLAPDDYVRLHEAVASGGGVLINRVAHVDEVAELVLYLSGNQSRSLTGAVIPFDAGFTAH
jgi:NAD(P)-dependent dehydrogenase (short-subunit alcohol dehydrogenase family)